jgi:hypothetical protein
MITLFTINVSHHDFAVKKLLNKVAEIALTEGGLHGPLGHSKQVADANGRNVGAGYLKVAGGSAIQATLWPEVMQDILIMNDR